jgi:PAS domain S-box-containing protein
MLTTSSSRILVVDDNPSIHEDFRKILCPERSQKAAAVQKMVNDFFGEGGDPVAPALFEMDSAFQGKEALAKVEAAEKEGRPYSLAFMDVRMPPGWDGIETIKYIWKEHPALQVVICTAYSDYSWDKIMESLGKTDNLLILKKPFDNVEVLQMAHTLTEKWLVTRKATARMADLNEAVSKRTAELLKANQQLESEIRRRTIVESALRESEDMFHRAFSTVAVPVSISALEDGRYLEVNQSFVRVTGYSEQEIIKETPDSLKLFPDPGAYLALLESLRHGGRIRNAELIVQRKDGSRRQTLASIELLNLKDQPCMIAALQDVTQQRSLEGQLLQAQKMEAVGQLAAGIAHDFNNLLTIIQGYTSLQLMRDGLEADVTEAFQHVRMASEKAAALTRQLLSYSRRQIIRRVPVNLGQMIDRMKNLLTRTLGETIEFECRIEPGLPQVLADESNLDQVIINLAVNARDAMPKGGKLTLSASSTTVNAEQADAHPERRRGSTFHAYWPAVEEKFPTPHSQPALTPPNPDQSPPASGAGVFVVEDEPEVRAMITSFLTSQGYRVEQASSGAEALRKWPLLASPIGVLVTDLVMPGDVNGIALFRELVRRQPNLRVIYTSGYSVEAVAGGHDLEEGGNFLFKPFTRDRLLSIVCKAFKTGAPSAEPASCPV